MPALLGLCHHTESAFLTDTIRIFASIRTFATGCAIGFVSHPACLNTATVSKSDSATFACPLNVSLPKNAYKVVQFLDAEKLIKTVEIGKK